MGFCKWLSDRYYSITSLFLILQTFYTIILFYKRERLPQISVFPFFPLILVKLKNINKWNIYLSVHIGNSSKSLKNSWKGKSFKKRKKKQQENKKRNTDSSVWMGRVCESVRGVVGRREKRSGIRRKQTTTIADAFRRQCCQNGSVNT